MGVGHSNKLISAVYQYLLFSSQNVKHALLFLAVFSRTIVLQNNLPSTEQNFRYIFKLLEFGEDVYSEVQRMEG